MSRPALREKKVTYNCNAPGCNFKADSYDEVDEHIEYNHHYYPVRNES